METTSVVEKKKIALWAAITVSVLVVKFYIGPQIGLPQSLVVGFIPMAYSTAKYGRRSGFACLGGMIACGVYFGFDEVRLYEVVASSVFLIMLLGDLRHKARLEPTLVWVMERLDMLLALVDATFKEWGYTNEQERLKQLGYIRSRLANFRLAVENRVALIHDDAVWHKKVDTIKDDKEA